jgi:hypothetical protein
MPPTWHSEWGSAPWPENPPTPAAPVAGPAWRDGPSVLDPFRRDAAHVAGKSALVGGFGPSPRRDQRIPCYQCKSCLDGRYDDCGNDLSRAEAQLHHHQREADRFDQADRWLEEHARIVKSREDALGMSF